MGRFFFFLSAVAMIRPSLRLLLIGQERSSRLRASASNRLNSRDDQRVPPPGFWVLVFAMLFNASGS